MKFRMLMSISVMIIFAVPMTSIRVSAQDRQDRRHAEARYSLTILDTLGGTDSGSQGINNRGQAVGSAALTGGALHAVRWNNGEILDLGSLQGGCCSSTLTDPNERGEVSGMSNTQTPDPNGEDFCFFGTGLICLGFLWRDGVMTPMPTLGGNNSLAYQINNRGNVVGVAETPAIDPTCSAPYLEAKPVVWQGGTLQELPLTPGDTDGFGYGINDRGQVVGATGTCNQLVPFTSSHAVLWPKGPNGGVIDLGNLGGTLLNIAFYINNRGQIVGQSAVAGSANCTPISPPQDCPFHAFLWQSGAMIDMGVLPGDIQSWASNINSKGQAVGTSFSATGARAFIWQNGLMTDLNTLTSPGSPLYLLEAWGINDRGEIAGFGQLSNGEHRGYLLTPCNEHHPGAEGCDYSMVEATALPSARSAQSEGPAQMSSAAALWHRNNRFHTPALGPSN
jgi:probable HAF family extracellular repeat protein